MPEENRVFDVSKPGQVGPTATSKPVIVGHHPIMNDPMVHSGDHAAPTRIAVHGAEEALPAPESHNDNKIFDHPEPTVIPPLDSHLDSPAIITQSMSEPAAAPAAEPGPSPVFPMAETDPDIKPIETLPPASSMPDLPPLNVASPGHVEGLHVGKGRRRKGPLVVLLLILALVVAAYLLIDSGVIKSSINLPFHVFKQKAVPAAMPPASGQNQAAAPSVPTGFTEYKLAGTALTFAAPTSWGTPTSSTEDGYSARGAGNKADGTHAYLVTFPSNKDVQVAVTSSQYLPPARATLYYDYLQWCTGTNDQDYYLGILHFTTTAKVDKPSTITCDQGPLDGVTKIDDTTIIQQKAKSPDGSVIGDIYTKNLQNTDLPVFRVKDVKMTNGDDIKSMLGTVQIPVSSQ